MLQMWIAKENTNNDNNLMCNLLKRTIRMYSRSSDKRGRSCVRLVGHTSDACVYPFVLPLRAVRREDLEGTALVTLDKIHTSRSTFTLLLGWTNSFTRIATKTKRYNIYCYYWLLILIIVFV